MKELPLTPKVSLCPQGKQWIENRRIPLKIDMHESNRCWTEPEHYGDIVMKRQRMWSSFRTAFCFSWLGIKEKSVFSIVLFSYGHSFPHPLFQQETERSPRSKSEGGSLAEKVIIVTNVPVLQCGQRCSNVPFWGLGDCSFTPNWRCSLGSLSRFHVPLNMP